MSLATSQTSCEVIQMQNVCSELLFKTLSETKTNTDIPFIQVQSKNLISWSISEVFVFGDINSGGTKGKTLENVIQIVMYL